MPTIRDGVLYVQAKTLSAIIRDGAIPMKSKNKHCSMETNISNAAAFRRSAEVIRNT